MAEEVIDQCGDSGGRSDDGRRPEAALPPLGEHNETPSDALILTSEEPTERNTRKIIKYKAETQYSMPYIE